MRHTERGVLREQYSVIRGISAEMYMVTKEQMGR